MKQLATVATLAVATVGLGAAPVLAEFPEEPITLVVSFAAGGNADIVARLSAEAVGQELGVPITVVNRPGGAHIPAAMSVVEADADGYTIFNWSPPSFMLVPLTRGTPYDPLEDFVPLFAGISASNALYVRADSPYETFEQFIEAARTENFTMGVNNLGAPPNLSAVQLASEFDLEFRTIVLDTVPATMTGLIGGQVDAAVGQVQSISQFGDEVRALAILDNARTPSMEDFLPGVPTVGEAFPGMEAGVWVHGGWAVPAGTPQEVVDTLLEATEVLGSPEFIESLPPGVGYTWVHGTEEVQGLIQSGRDLYTPILESLGLLSQ